MTAFENLVSPAWVLEHREDLDLVVIDCRFALAAPNLGRRQYEQGHVPGAVYFDLNRDLSSPVQAHGGRHPLPRWDDLIPKLEAAGISSGDGASQTRVVVYDDSRFAFAARLWWLLKYLGHDAVAVMDGGFRAWQQAGYPLSAAIPQPRSGRFQPAPRPDRVVTLEQVRQRKDQDGVVLIDSRAPERFRGEVEPIDPVAGSIPGAVNYFWQAVTDAGGFMRPTADLAQHWSDLDGTEEVIVYCGSGVTACVNLLSQTLAGQPMGKLYVGGWSDWCSYGKP
jgi:thiosulfate/3-mercaptopyruvate sulfurtransferase